MLEVFKTDKAETRALVDFSASEVRALVRALDATADATLGLVRIAPTSEQRVEFAVQYDEVRSLADRLRLLKV